MSDPLSPDAGPSGDHNQHHGRYNQNEPSTNKCNGNSQNGTTYQDRTCASNHDMHCNVRSNEGASNMSQKHRANFHFTRLEKLSHMNSDEAIAELMKEKTEFEEFLRDTIRPDLLVVMMRVMVNICKTEFIELLTSVLSTACSATFMKNMEKYLMQLPFEHSAEKIVNQLYHTDPNAFWLNLVVFFEKIIEFFPSKACDELMPILERIIKIIAIINQSDLEYTINMEIKDRVEVMLDELKEEIKENEITKQISKGKISEVQEEDPPDDFRSLSVIPTREDLNQQIPFLRKNKIEGSYDSVEHYLDIQFRLLREDFLSPLRDGVAKYLESPSKYHHSELRVYKKVNLLKPDVTTNSVGIMISFGIMKHVKWAHSKRFLFGGLLCLSRDNFNTVQFAVVGDRDVKNLEKGLLLIQPCEGTVFDQDHYDSEFVMLESKVLFEPYMVVLTALRNMNQHNFPMEKYIVDADTSITLPEYLNEVSVLRCDDHFLPLAPNTIWPTSEQLQLDATQYNAFKAALTQEFTVIQGPPGTGKTYMALKIIKTLLENKKFWLKKGPIIVVCFTNHALDQFLEGVLPYTKSIVRVGSRSKNEALEPYMLTTKRQITPTHSHKNARTIMYELKQQSKYLLNDIRDIRLLIKYLNTPDAILPLRLLKQCCRDSQLDALTSDQALLDWLLGSDAISIKNDLYVSQSENANAMVHEDISEDGDNMHMDNELELLYGFNITASDKLLLPLQLIDDQCDIIVRKSCELFQNVVEGEDLNRLINRRKDLRGLRVQHAFWQRALAQHPLVKENQKPVHVNARWTSYWGWIRLAYDNAMTYITRLEQRYRQLNLELNEAKQVVDLDVMRQHEIVGLTTTGAAKLHASLHALASPIVLVEEAAEILEAHVVCSLTAACKHAILIGDHKQLRPKPAVHELATKYNLNISLFERMVNIRGSCTQLAYQHRMRPEIAKLISPSIYGTLHNHPSVLDYPSVKGVTKNVLFLNHENQEVTSNEESWTNPHEVQFLIAFARHLILQGYKETEITILCTYTGQLFALMKEKERHHLLEGLRVTSVDNYQGEENRIILLSLVRNNKEGNIGFLKEENRVCVALSRAREGLYIMGNMENLTRKNNIWTQIKEVLETEEAIVNSIQLQCAVHADQLIQVQTATDFQKCPEGGCSKICNADLSCGHTCTSICHISNSMHENYTCIQPCLKKCPYGHSCLLKCLESCEPCHEIVHCELPTCGHTVSMPCGTDSNTFLCPVEVSSILPYCNHTVQKPCYWPPETYPCPYPCEIRLNCGHSCTLKCHANKDPDHLEYKCPKDCPKKNIGCTKDHKCTKLCWEECSACRRPERKTRSCGHIYDIKCSESVEKILCKQPCKVVLPCGHKCKQKCHFTCGNCEVPVVKVGSCGHKIRVKCCEEASVSKCFDKCQRKLACGHPCTARCKDECITICGSMLTSPKTGLCGHDFSVPCYLQSTDRKSETLLMYCQQPCNTELACHHICNGTCSSCKQGRIHLPCSKSCGNILVCGHKCLVPCREECPPCNEPCKSMCRHNKCKKKCGVPCVQCKEPCGWSCPHSTCTKRCYELCNREPCMEQCPEILECKHPCIGFCGEPCPPLCLICNKDQLAEAFFLGQEDEPDARFIFLEDCGHCIESRGLETWVSQGSHSIQMQTCPRCKTPITKCARIMNKIKTHLHDLQIVKEKVFGNPKKVFEKQSILHKDIKAMLQNEKLTAFEDLSNLLAILNTNTSPVYKRKKQFMSAREVESTRIILNIIKEIAEILNEIRNRRLKSFNWIEDQIVLLVKALPTGGRISNQEVSDMNRELSRLEWMRKFHKVDIMASKNGLKSDDMYEILQPMLLCNQQFTQSQELLIQKELNKFSVENVINERKMIVQAMGFKQGHWYKCPNGHLYTRGECGGATLESRCIVCRAAIGGTSHRLRSNDALASEMDGATKPA